MLIGAHSNPGNLSGNDGPLIEREASLLSTHQHWWSTWTGPDEFDQAEMDLHNAMVDWADERGLKVHAWLPFGAEHYCPEWLVSRAGSVEGGELEGYLRNAVRAVAASGGNAEQVDFWTAVNEPFRPEGTYVDTLWNRIGSEEDRSGLSGEEAPLVDGHPRYIAMAFREAAEAMNGAPLGLRENNMEFPGLREYHSTYQLARHLLNSDVPLGVIEFQMHMNAYPAGSVDDLYLGAQNQDGSYNWDGFVANVDRYHELGLQVHLTEVDFYTSGFEPGSAAARDAQATAAYGLMEASRRSGVEVVTNWGLREGSMDGQSNDGKVQIFEADGTPKPAYDALKQALIDTAG